MKYLYKTSVKMSCCTMLILIMMLSYGQAQNSQSLEFKLNPGDIYVYKIDIEFSQENSFDSYSENDSESGSVVINGTVALYESIDILENNGDYAKIICRYDSVTINLNSTATDSTSTIDVIAAKDNIRILRNDSLLTGYTTESASTGAAYDFYDKLLFIGENITMLVSPDGEIMNITENKILWDMAQEMIGLPGEGFLEIILPQTYLKSGKSSWEQSININKFGEFKLKQKPQPLVIDYRGEKRDEFNISFDGSLLLDLYETDISAADLADEISLGVKDFQITKKGSAIFSIQRGILENVSYTVERQGEITLIGSGLEDYETGLIVRFRGNVSYNLIDL